MKLVPCNEDDLKIVKSKTDIYKTLSEFIHSDCDIMEIKDFTHKSAVVCAGCISQSVKRYRFNIQVVKRGERVFLVRKT